MESLLLINIFLLFAPILCEISFEKESGMDTEFPPNLNEHTSPYIRKGHLRPLGFQHPSERRITKYSGFPSSSAFYHGYVKEEQPILFTEAVPTEKMKLWTDEYLKKTYGDLKVRVTIKRARIGQQYRLLKIKKFLKEYKYEDWYLSTIIPQQMRKDMPFPKVLQCGTISRYLQESQLWMSSGGTYSLLHYHGDHQLHCLLDGRKDFIFIHNKFADDFQMKKSDDFTASGHSDMDTHMVNMYKYEAAGSAPWEWATMTPGDCIFVPAGILHHVRSYGRSVSSVTHWTPTQDVDFTDCAKEKMKVDNKKTLEDANLMWTFLDGKRLLSNIKLNSESLRHHLSAILRKDKDLPYSYFESFFLTALKGVKEAPNPSDLWKLLNPKKEYTLSRVQLLSLPRQTLEEVATSLNKALEKVLPKKEKQVRKRDEL